MPRNAAIITILVAILLSPSRAASQSIAADETFPSQHRPVDVRVTDADGAPVAGAAMTATYRPNSSVSRTDSIGTSAADGTVEWVPADAGIVTLKAEWEGEDGQVSATTNVSVRFSSVPIAGVVIMVFAGIVLIIGSIVRIARFAGSSDYTT